jgi:ABC-type Fe3+-hydroxamate transport system substrate-binding protein
MQAAVPRFRSIRTVNAKVAALASMLAGLAMLSACAQPPKPHAITMPRAKRIVTLMPSFAEDLCAIGAGSRLVGVSEYSDGAACARRLPRVANFAAVDAERVIALRPDAVVGIPAQQILTSPLRRAGIATIFLPDDSYDDIFADIRQLGAITGHERQAGSVVAQLRQRTQTLQKSEHFARRPSVFVVLQAQPIWTVGPQSYISSLLQLAGARNAVGVLPRPYAQYSAEALLRLQPDAIVAGSDTRLPSLLDREPWRSLRAVREKHVFILTDPGVLERPGPNYNEGLSWLIEHLRPLTT